MHASRFCPKVGKSGQKWAKAGKSGQKRAKRHVAPVFASPLPRPRSLLCALHTSTRAQSTLVTHAPCVRRTMRARLASHAHATRACMSKARMACSCHWPLADCRPARCMRIWLEHALQMRSPPPLLVRRMRHSHAVHAMHHHRCRVCRRVMALQRHNSAKRAHACRWEMRSPSYGVATP